MYSYEDRIQAVKLYIKLGKRTGPTIRKMGTLNPKVGLEIAQHLRRRKVVLRSLGVVETSPDDAPPLKKDHTREASVRHLPKLIASAQLWRTR